MKTFCYRYGFVLFAATLIFSTLPFVCAAQDKQDDEVIKVDTNLVVLNAVVTDVKGDYVSGLRQKDFQIFEDGQPQTIDTFGAESTPFAAVVLMDTSGSMETRMSVARAAAIKFLDGLREDDVAAVYNFNSKVKLIQEFSGSRDLSPVAYDLKSDGMTVLNDAIIEAAKILSTRTEKRRAIVVLSDGADTMSKASQNKALQTALAVSATIYTVDMSAFDEKDKYTLARKQSVGALKNFAEKSGGRFVAVSGGAEMRDAFKQIVDELSIQYTIGYQPTNTARDGKYRVIEAKLARPALTVRTRKGYNAPKK
jgi:Ca-activated chloride channel family protein